MKKVWAHSSQCNCFTNTDETPEEQEMRHQYCIGIDTRHWDEWFYNGKRWGFMI